MTLKQNCADSTESSAEDFRCTSVSFVSPAVCA